MLFSIVIPVYNVEKYLDECMQSILSQLSTIENDCEILLIDDGSTDQSGSICDNYKNKYPDIVNVYHKKNKGLLATRRYGYKRASGEYIVNCDSDDLLEPGMLFKIKDMILKYRKPDVLLFNYYYLEQNSKKLAYTNIFSKEPNASISKKEVLKMFLKNHSVVSLCAKVYKNDCIENERDYSQFYKISNGEDTLQSIEIYNNAETYVYINAGLYDYRIGTGMTRKFDGSYFKGFKIVLREIQSQKEIWNIEDFNKLFSIKVLQTVGRAITQSRYNVWPSFSAHRSYLNDIRNDSMVDEAIQYLYGLKRFLQKSHYYLLIFFKLRLFKIIYIFLGFKNKLC